MNVESTHSNPPWEQLLKIAMRSPSGDNCQPWFFTAESNTLKIKILKNRSVHFLNKSGRADYISLGCVVESLLIESEKIGWTFYYKLETDGDLALEFKKSNSISQIDNLSSNHRYTYRGSFRKYDIKDETDLLKIESLIREVIEKRFSNIKFVSIQKFSTDLKEKLFKIENLLWSHPNMITDFLNWIRFSEKDWHNKKDGFFRKEVDIQIPDIPTLYLTRKFKFILQIVKYLMPLVIKLKTSKWHNNVISNFYLFSESKAPQDIIELGRASFYLWSKCNQMNYAVQPITMSTLTSCDVVDGYYEQALKPSIVEQFTVYLKALKQELGMQQGVVWGFRIGLEGKKNDVKSLRRDLSLHFKK